MTNKRLHWLLSEPKGPSRNGQRGKPLWTIGKIAAEICSGRAHVTETLNNKPGRGRHTRRRLARFFKKEFPKWKEILECLGWEAELKELIKLNELNEASAQVKYDLRLVREPDGTLTWED